MQNEVVLSPTDLTIQIRRWKVREGYQVSRNHVILLYEEVGGGNKEVKRMKASQTGTVKKRFFKDGDIVSPGIPLMELRACIHTTVIKEMCADCGADLRKEDNGKASGETASVPMIHSVPELKVTQKLAQKLGKADTKRLLEDRKLVLLVDLDQTIIHTTNDNVPNNLRGVYHFQLYGPNSPWYHTRLRPGTFDFLSRMESLFELHICTFGARNYAHMIAQFLDEDGKYFSHRILSRDECFNLTSKTDNLSALFPCGDSMVCIIDDREDVWNMASNLIQVKPYHFFQHTGDINAPPGLAKHELDGKGVNFKDLEPKNDEKTEDESAAVQPPTTETKPEETSTSDGETAELPTVSEEETTKPSSDSETVKQLSGSDSDDNLIDIEDPDDYLLYLETILKQIHQRFYESYDENSTIADLKTLIPKIRSEVLLGRTLVFSGLVPNQLKLEQSKAYLIARNLGATVKQQLNDDTTHLVAATSGTFKVHAARKRSDIKVVQPEWLWACAERWECVDERLYPLDPLKPSKMRQPPPHCHSPEHSVSYSETDGVLDGAKSKHSTGRGGTKTTHGSVAGPSAAASSSSSVPLAVQMVNNSADGNVDDDDDEPKFIDTINPLLSFTNDDLADMNQEFDQFFESDESSSDNEPDDMENPPIDKKLKKKRRREDEKEQRTKPRKFFSTEADEPSTSSRLPASTAATASTCSSSSSSSSSPKRRTPMKKRRRKMRAGGDRRNVLDSEGHRVDGHENEVSEGDDSESSEEKECAGYQENEDDDLDDEDDRDDDEMPSERFRRGGDIPSDLDIGSECGSAGSEDPIDDEEGDWNIMGAALERDFLGLE